MIGTWRWCNAHGELTLSSCHMVSFPSGSTPEASTFKKTRLLFKPSALICRIASLPTKSAAWKNVTMKPIWVQYQLRLLGELKSRTFKNKLHYLCSPDANVLSALMLIYMHWISLCWKLKHTFFILMKNPKPASMGLVSMFICRVKEMISQWSEWGSLKRRKRVWKEKLRGNRKVRKNKINWMISLSLAGILTSEPQALNPFSSLIEPMA